MTRRSFPKMMAKSVIKALIETYGRFERSNRGKRWATFPEFRVGTGYGARGQVVSPEQRIDLFAMSCYPSDGFTRHAYEVKVSRRDWLQEMRQPYKRMAAYRMCNRFYFAAPAGMIDQHEVPDGCGLVEIAQRADGVKVASTTLEAPFHESDPPTWMTVAAMARRST